MSISPPSPSEVDRRLGQLGIALGPASTILFTDVATAEQAYIHHSSEPLALAAYAMVSPTFAKGRLPGYELIQLVRKRPSMDGIEITAFAAVCGVTQDQAFWADRDAFGAHLVTCIDRYGLTRFFGRFERRNTGPDHHNIRPIGFDWLTVDQPEIPGALRAWRADYRKLPLIQQLWVTTVLTLYLMRDDRHWMVRIPKRWHAADAIHALREDGSLSDWARLVALYPGW